MHSPNKRPMTRAERAHVERVKAAGCVCCDAQGITEAHEIEQGSWFTAVSLCPDCHRGPNGLHGTKTYMRVRKLTELAMLNETLRRLSCMSQDGRSLL